MIKSVTITNNASLPIKWITEEKSPFRNGDIFNFSPVGINVIFGPNGSGKSTLMKMLAKLTFCYEVGTPVIDHETLMYLEDYLPQKWYSRGKRKELGITIDKDTGICYYLKSGKMVGLIGGTTKYPKTGYMDEFKESCRIQEHSDGQIQTKELDRLILRLEKHKVPEAPTCYISGEDDKKKIEVANKMMGTGEGIPTIFMDEPDRNMDYVQSSILWDKLRTLESKYQIIIASHHIPLLNKEGVNVIPFKDDTYAGIGIPSYIRHCKSFLK